MNSREFNRKMSGKIHHLAKITLNDGSTKEGYIQPPDDQYAYLTALDGTTGGKVAIADIKQLDFPNDS